MSTLIKCVVPLILLLVGGCTSAPREQVLQGVTMGSAWTVKIVGESQADAAHLRAGIQAQFDAVESALSTYRNDSALSRFNAAPHGGWQALDPELARVLELALSLAQLSHGAYDVTVGPLVDLWGFGPGVARNDPPDQQSIRAAQSRVGWRKVELDAAHHRARRPPGVRVDLSSLGKGRGVDRVAEWLESQGIHNYLIDLSGKLRASGLNARGFLWQVGVESPGPDDAQGEESMSVAVLHLVSEAVASAGDYRRYFERRGKHYSHLIDPRSGYPIVTGMASVTVRVPSCLAADAWATVLMVMEPERAMALAEMHGLPALLIVRTPAGMSVRASSYWKPGSEPATGSLQASVRRPLHEI